jgi:Rieske Fe-S protein
MAAIEPSERAGEPGASDAPGSDRRSFLAAAGAVAVVPSVAGAAVAFFAPLKSGRPTADFVHVTGLAALPPGALPVRLTVRDERTDAWTRYAEAPVGSVYLRRTDDGVEALNAICPHAGCLVGLDGERGRFVCPCHDSVFELDGTRVEGPSPRDMDSLEARIDDDGGVRVRFRDFRPGTEEKVPV